MYPSDDEDDTMPCPHCGEAIYDDSERCPRCGRYLSREDEPSGRSGWFIACAVICLILAVLWVLRG